jgi:hypothetical protein
MNNIIEYIKTKQGFKNAVPSAEIERLYKIDEKSLRDLVVEYIRKHHELVGSSQSGYFWIVDENDYKITRSHRIAPFVETKKTVDALDFNWEIFSKIEELKLI